VGWILIIPLFLILAALPVTFAMVAVRPSQTTLRAAGVTLLAPPVLVILIVIAGAMA
jgi:hypothetical protein